MAFILSRERADDVSRVFGKYAKYLEEKAEVFPESAYRLATSAWHFDPNDKRCPHDSWLEEVRVIENSEGERREVRNVSI